jgi:hypothetical protein
MSSKTVLFLESGNDITTVSKYMTPLHVTNVDAARNAQRHAGQLSLSRYMVP